jgi:GrpB-like predicted nucleotidyltransferase (UPF0157 family)
MKLMLGLPKGQVFLVPWCEEWEAAFKEEELKIRSEINEYILEIHHIGSTAVKGLSAKPIIDIAIEIEAFETGIKCVPGLEKIGYSYKGIGILPDRYYFNKGEPRTHQIHMYQAGSEYLHRQLILRDYLRTNDLAREQYQELKERLVQQNSSDKLQYADAKTDFINKLIMEAGR